jgi:hypothetical protein
MPIILATEEAEIRKIAAQSQPGQIVQETPSQKKTITKKAGGVAQGIGLEFKLQYHKKKKRHGECRERGNRSENKEGEDAGCCTLDLDLKSLREFGQR